MRIWYDAGTGKQVRYSVAIAKRLRVKGHEIIMTTRDHPDTLSIAESLGEKHVVVGRYNPKTLQTRLKSGTKRQLSFSKIFEKNVPDVAVSHGQCGQRGLLSGAQQGGPGRHLFGDLEPHLHPVDRIIPCISGCLRQRSRRAGIRI